LERRPALRFRPRAFAASCHIRATRAQDFTVRRGRRVIVWTLWAALIPITPGRRFRRIELPRWESRVRRSRRQREKMAIDVICTRTSSTATDGMGTSTNERACPARSPVSEALVSLWEMSQSRFMPRLYSFPIFRCSSVAACAIETHVAPRLSTRDKRTL
jgi:hypothetical protein